jgi:hypothetical protein
MICCDFMSDDNQLEELESEDKDAQEETTTYKVISYGADYTIQVLYQKLAEGSIIIPEFQRNYVWKLPQASKLVESFLMGLPVPPIFLAKDRETQKLMVVDGNQRLKTIKGFKDKIFPKTEQAFRLTDVAPAYIGKTYDDLDGNVKRKFDDSVLRSIIVEQVEPHDNQSIYHLFQRLNSGGTTLTNQEIRNCVFSGSFNNLLIRLNSYNNWRKLYKKEKPDERMRDVELILRFFALFYNIEQYEKPMNEFLNIFMAKNRKITNNAKSTEMENLFKTTIDFIYEKLSIESLRPRGNLNVAVFDSITYTIAKYRQTLKSDISYNTIKSLFDDTQYLKSVREGTTDPEVIKIRMNLAKKYLVG